MAYIRKRGKRWHAEICKTGPDGQQVRESASRSTKAEAVAWAEQREAEIAGGAVCRHGRFDPVLRPNT